MNNNRHSDISRWNLLSYIFWAILIIYVFHSVLWAVQAHWADQDHQGIPVRYRRFTYKKEDCLSGLHRGQILSVPNTAYLPRVLSLLENVWVPSTSCLRRVLSLLEDVWVPSTSCLPRVLSLLRKFGSLVHRVYPESCLYLRKCGSLVHRVYPESCLYLRKCGSLVHRVYPESCLYLRKCLCLDTVKTMCIIKWFTKSSV